MEARVNQVIAKLETSISGAPSLDAIKAQLGAMSSVRYLCGKRELFSLVQVKAQADAERMLQNMLETTDVLIARQSPTDSMSISTPSASALSSPAKVK